MFPAPVQVPIAAVMTLVRRADPVIVGAAVLTGAAASTGPVASE